MCDFLYTLHTWKPNLCEVSRKRPAQLVLREGHYHVIIERRK